ncbi:MAG: efflux RND transporter periplasmic adaptor subunit [Chloroflexi bacterium]|nr:efflux RND transporter periplasmic adaptor subunit [Chloroflexota bacterium]
MRKRIVLIAVILILAAGGGYFAYTKLRPATTTTATTQTATVTRGNLTALVASAGSIAPKAQASLTFGQSGTVTKVYVKLGDTVKQGQVLAEIEATDLQIALANAQIAYNQAQAKYDQTKAGTAAGDLQIAQMNVDMAQANFDLAVKKANLNDDQLLLLRADLDKAALSMQKAQSDYDQAVADHITDLSDLAVALKQAKISYDVAQANNRISLANISDSSVRSAAVSLASSKLNLQTLQSAPTAADRLAAESSLATAKLSLQQAQYRMRNAQVIAPYDGTATALNIDVYSTVSASTAAMQLSDLSQLQITVNMAEVDIAKVKVGQDVNVTVDAVSSAGRLSGKVTQVALSGTSTSGVVTYPVVITVSGADPTVVKSGMTANVSIIVDKRENVLLVPNRALRTQGGQRVVQLQTPVGVAQTPVTIGLAGDTQTEIVSGIKEGDVVVITSTTSSSSTNRTGGVGVPGMGPGF